jgi:hypothetical protein
LIGKKRIKKARGKKSVQYFAPSLLLAKASAKRSRRPNANAAQGTVSEERLFRPDGQRDRVLTLDANSATFTTDLTLVFEKNVARARRQHKKKFGSDDRAGQKA